MKRALQIIAETFAAHRPVLCFSGGRDSAVLLDMVFRHTDYRPPIVYVHNDLMRPATRGFVEEVSAHYGAALTVATPKRPAHEQWQRTGFPILGPVPANNWMRRYRHLGVRLNCTACCRALKTVPGRSATRALACDAQLVGARATDDQNHFYKLATGEAISYIKADRLWVAQPLAHWTDAMIRRYHRAYSLPTHPGDGQSGCECCAGGWRFTGNAMAALRQADPQAWRRHLLDGGLWLPLLVVKLHKPADVVCNAVERMGGIEALLQQRPWIFDYAQTPPLEGYAK
jgi:3'-phosphoadenosine 5'-phosphosulfate sulfotransferase (PAPS reductase)/FAD synthetase